MNRHGLKNSKTRIWKIEAKKETKNVADITMYGPIASEVWWGDEITPKDFKKELDALGDSVDTLNIYINSPGGDVFAGQTIYSMLKRHSATKITYVDGLAASIASVILEAGDKRIMPNNTMVMIHNAWTWGVGNAKQFRKLADDMDKIDESIINTYGEKASIDREKIIELMEAETWMTAEDALGYGFIDEIEPEKAIAASVKDNILTINGQSVDLSEFKNAPKIFALPTNNAPEGTSPPQPSEPPEEPEEPEETEETETPPEPNGSNAKLILLRKQLDLKEKEII